MRKKPRKPNEKRDWIYEKIPIPDKLDLPRIKLHIEKAQKSDLLSIQEVANVLGVAITVVYRLFHIGKLKGKKVNGRYCIFRKSIERYKGVNNGNE